MIDLSLKNELIKGKVDEVDNPYSAHYYETRFGVPEAIYWDEIIRRDKERVRQDSLRAGNEEIEC